MKLTKDVYLVGSGEKGIHLTDAFDCHIYLIDGGNELAIIDTGCGMGIGQILENIKEHEFSLDKLKYLILTHAHADHAGGAKKLLDYTGVEVIASPIAAEYLESGNEEAISLAAAKKAGFFPNEYTFEACPVSRRVNEGDIIQVGTHMLKVIDTPGHCNGHISLYMETEERTYLFAGDLVFFEGKVATQFIHDCDVFAVGNSLKKLKDLKIDTLLSGHDLFVLKNGQAHINRAIESIERLVIPSSIIY
jgi:hydroxyacylglutathione hydrolase